MCSSDLFPSHDNTVGDGVPVTNVKANDTIEVFGDGLNGSNVMLDFDLYGTDIPLKNVTDIVSNNGSKLIAKFKSTFVTDTLIGIGYDNNTFPSKSSIKMTEFPLDNIDEMRETILAFTMNPDAFNINTHADILPYSIAVDNTSDVLAYSFLFIEKKVT